MEHPTSPQTPSEKLQHLRDAAQAAFHNPEQPELHPYFAYERDGVAYAFNLDHTIEAGAQYHIEDFPVHATLRRFTGMKDQADALRTSDPSAFEQAIERGQEWRQQQLARRALGTNKA